MKGIEVCLFALLPYTLGGVWSDVSVYEVIKEWNHDPTLGAGSKGMMEGLKGGEPVKTETDLDESPYVFGLILSLIFSFGFECFFHVYVCRLLIDDSSMKKEKGKIFGSSFVLESSVGR